MANRKKIANIILLSLFSLLFSFSVQASGEYRDYDGGHNYYDGGHKDYDGGHRDYDGGHSGGSCNNVGAPLDGGLLTLLAGAGIAYIATRKKRKTED